MNIEKLKEILLSDSRKNNIKIQKMKGILILNELFNNNQFDELLSLNIPYITIENLKSLKTLTSLINENQHIDEQQFINMNRILFLYYQYIIMIYKNNIKMKNDNIEKIIIEYDKKQTELIKYYLFYNNARNIMFEVAKIKGFFIINEFFNKSTINDIETTLTINEYNMKKIEDICFYIKCHNFVTINQLSYITTIVQKYHQIIIDVTKDNLIFKHIEKTTDDYFNKHSPLCL